MRFIFLTLFITFTFQSFANIETSSTMSKEIWQSLETIGQIEKIDIVQTDGEKKYISIDKLACVFEMYNACAFYTNVQSTRKFIVALDGSARLMRLLAAAGVYVDEESARMALKTLSCSSVNDVVSCSLEEYPEKRE